MSRHRLTQVAGGITVVALVAWAAISLPLKEWITAFLMWMRDLGPAGAFVYGVTYVLGTALAVPGVALTAGAGLIYGPVIGVLIVSPASVLGTTIAFLIARHFARGWVEKKLSRYPRFNVIDRAIAKKGFKVVLLLRLEPVVIPFALLNYGLGVTSVRLRDYILGSFLGMLPATILYVYLGSALHDISALVNGKLPDAGIGGQVLFWLGLVATVLLVIIIGKIARRALHEELDEPSHTERKQA